jgi:hypothetical protein
MAVMNPPIFMQAALHPAERWRQAHKGIMGLRGGVVGLELAVAQHAGTPNMSVDVAEGHVFVPGTEATYQGVYLGEAQGVTVVTIAAADPTNPRRDLIIARVRDTSYSGAGDTFAIEPVQGTPAGSPSDPALPTGSCWVLARVAVAALASSITNANITDFRYGGTGYTGQNGASAALGGIIVCTSSTRPLSGLYPGLTIWQTDTKNVAVYNGSTWDVGGTRGIAATVGSYNIPAGAATSTGVTVSLPAGTWQIHAKAEGANVTGGAEQMTMELYNLTGAVILDTTRWFSGDAGAQRMTLACQCQVTLSATSTIQVRAISNLADGSANHAFNNIQLHAVSVI